LPIGSSLKFFSAALLVLPDRLLCINLSIRIVATNQQGWTRLAAITQKQVYRAWHHACPAASFQIDKEGL
jgi:hypothetical protein